MSIKNDQKKVNVIKKRLLWVLMIFTAGLVVFQFSRVWAATQVPGTIAGTFQPVQGTAGYTIPIPVPPGRGDMTPQLNLSYNSQNGDGPMGVGWRLDGTLMILRGVHTTDRSAGYNNKRRPAYDDTDQLTLNGKELKLISGTHLTEGAVYMSAIDIGMQIVMTSGSFIAKTKDGRTLEFGHAWTVDGTDIGWAISAAFDGYGNGVEYNYLADTDVPYLESIYYTSHDSTKGFVNESGGKSTLGWVGFFYKTYSSKSRVVVNGETLYNTHLLDYIFVSPKASTTTLADSDEFQRYDLTYEDALSGSGVQRLKSIQVTEKRYIAAVTESDDPFSDMKPIPLPGEEADDSRGEYFSTLSEYTMPATTFLYNDAEADTTGEFQVLDDQLVNNVSNGLEDANRYVSGDFDGDGRLDIVAITKNESTNKHNVHVYPHNSYHQIYRRYTADISSWQDRNSNLRHRFHAADVDEDGKSELIEVYMAPDSSGTYYEIRVDYWNFHNLEIGGTASLTTSKSAHKMIATQYPVGGSNWNTAWESSTTDWNADGRNDLVIYGRLTGTGTTGLWVSPHLNKGDGSFEGNAAFASLPYAAVDTYDLEDYRRAQYKFVDATDDGKPDLLEIYTPDDGSSTANLRVFENTGYGITEIGSGGWWNISNWYNRSPMGEEMVMAYYQLADMNMDGRTDLVVVNRDYIGGYADTSFFWNEGNGKFRKKTNLTVRTAENLTVPSYSCSNIPAGLPDETPRHFVGDYDNDGYPDVMVYRYGCDSSNNWEQSAGVHIFKNNAGTVASTSSFSQTFEDSGRYIKIDPWNRNPPVMPIVFDDDSAMDLVEAYEKNDKIYLRIWTREPFIQPPDLLTSITDGHGVETTIEYANAETKNHWLSSLDLEVHGYDFYTQGSSDTDNRFDMVPGHYLVKGYTTKQSNGNVVADATYRYQGNQYDYVYGSLGFEYIYTYNELTGHSSKTRYYQTYPMTGYKHSTEYYHGVSGQPNLLDSYSYTTQNYSGTNDVWMVLPSTTGRALQQNGAGVDGVADRWSTYTYDEYSRLTEKKEIFGGRGNADRRSLKTTYTYTDNSNGGNSPDNTTDISAADLDAYHLGFYDTRTTVEIDTSDVEVTGSSRQTSYTYTAGLKVATATTHLGVIVDDDITMSYGYDAYGNIIKETDGEGYEWATTYDSYAQFPQSKTNPLGHKKQFVSHDNLTGESLKVIDENNVTHRTMVGAFGRPDIRLAPGSDTTSTHQMDYFGKTDVVGDGNSIYDNAQTGSVPATWSAASMSRVSLRGYDDLGRTVTEVSPETPYQEIVWGANGKPSSRRVIKSSSFAGHLVNNFVTHTYTYDAFSNQQKHIRDGVTLSEEIRNYSSGTSQHNYPSPAGDVTTTTSFVHNVLGKIKKRTLPSGDTHTYEYNIYGKVISITDPTGQLSTNTYDMADRLKTQYTGETGTVSYGYDKRSLPVKRTNADGKTIEMAYDALGRLTHRYTEGNGTLYLKEMVYDNPQYSYSVGRLTDVFIRGTDGSAPAGEPDTGGSGSLGTGGDLVGEPGTGSFDDILGSLGDLFDSFGKMRRSSTSQASYKLLAKYSYNYDVNGGVSTHTRELLNGTSYDTYTFDSTYHPDGTPDTITYPDGSKVRYTKSEYSGYDNITKMPRLSKIEYAENGTDFVTVKTYDEYNLYGQPTLGYVFPNLQNTTKTIFDSQGYDHNGQLHSLYTADLDESIGFYYEVKQRSELGFVNSVWAIHDTKAGPRNYTTTYDYTDEGWLVSADNTNPESYGQETYTYLSDGRRDSDQTYTYIWNSEPTAHQLAGMTDSDGMMDDEQISQVTYAYDANGAMNDQWTKKWKAADNAEYNFQQRVFAYDAENMLEREYVYYHNTGKWSGSHINRRMYYYYDQKGQRFYKKMFTAAGTTETFYITPSYVAEQTTINGSSAMEYTKYIMGVEGVVASLKPSDTAAGAMAPLVPFKSRWMAADMYRWDHPMGFIKKIGTYAHALSIHPRTVGLIYLMLKALPAALILAILIALLISSRGIIDPDSFRYRYPVLARVTWAVLFFFAIQMTPTLPRQVFAFPGEDSFFIPPDRGGIPSQPTETYETYYRDLFGNITMTLQASSSDSKGYVVLSNIHYRPFGSVDFGTSINSEKTRYTFSGKEIDFLNSAEKEQGPVYFGARYYDSFSGRYLTPDPKAQFSDPYMYCWNSPQNAVDPDGQFATLLLAAIFVTGLALGVSSWIYAVATWGNRPEVAEGAMLSMKITGGILAILCGVALGAAVGIGAIAISGVSGVGLSTALASPIGIGITLVAAGLATRFLWGEELYGNMMMYFGTGLAVSGVCTLTMAAAPWAAQTAFASVAANLFNYNFSWYFGGCLQGWDPSQWDYDSEYLWAYAFAQVGVDFGVGHFSGVAGTKMTKLVKAGKMTKGTKGLYEALLGGVNGTCQNLLWSGMNKDSSYETGQEASIGFAVGFLSGGIGAFLGHKLSTKPNWATVVGNINAYGGILARVSARDAVSKGDPLAWL